MFNFKFTGAYIFCNIPEILLNNVLCHSIYNTVIPMQKCTKYIIKITAYEKQNVSSYIKIVNTIHTVPLQ